MSSRWRDKGKKKTNHPSHQGMPSEELGLGAASTADRHRRKYVIDLIRHVMRKEREKIAVDDEKRDEEQNS